MNATSACSDGQVLVSSATDLLRPTCGEAPSAPVRSPTGDYTGPEIVTLDT